MGGSCWEIPNLVEGTLEKKNSDSPHLKIRYWSRLNAKGEGDGRG